MTPTELFAYLTELAWRERRAAGTDVVELPFGEAVITADLPLVYDQNIVRVSRPPADAAQVLDAVAEIAAGASWQHRNIEVTDVAAAAQLRQGLLGAGLTEARHVTMVLRDGQARDVPSRAGSAAVVDPESVRDLGRAMIAQEPWASGDDVLEQFAERERRLARVVDVRAVVAPPERPVSRCLLLSDDAVTEIDAVSTLTAHRGQGWSTAVMAAAIAAGREGPGPVLLVADAADWPRHWYGRLGFVEIGSASQFRRSPGD